MANFRTLWVLIGASVFAGNTVTPASAGTAISATESSAAASAAMGRTDAANEVVTVSAARLACEGASPEEARRIAKEAQKNGAYRRAAECFRAAGDHARADRALVRASAETGADTRRKAAITADTARAQMKRLKDAFR